MALLPAVGRKRGGRTRRALYLIFGILWLGVVLHLFPVYWMLISSIEGNVQNFSHPVSFWPHPALPQVYGVLLRGASELLPLPMLVYLRNSAVLAVGVMCTQIPISIFGAYAISRLHSRRWARLLFLFIIGTMMIPSEVTLIPSYLILKNFPFPANTHLPHVDFLNTLWAVILPSMAWAWAVLIFKGWFDSIPRETMEAARVDGAGEGRILWNIVLPLSLPVIAFIAYQTFSSVWDSFTWPLIVLQNVHTWPLSVALNNAQSSLVASPSGPQPLSSGILGWNGVMAMAVLQSIPVFVMFILFREQIVRGVKITGLNA
jgi:ABC-type glycerol-3-phosphate transport system permease component